MNSIVKFRYVKSYQNISNFFFHHRIKKTNHFKLIRFFYFFYMVLRGYLKYLKLSISKNKNSPSFFFHKKRALFLQSYIHNRMIEIFEDMDSDNKTELLTVPNWMDLKILIKEKFLLDKLILKNSNLSNLNFKILFPFFKTSKQYFFKQKANLISVDSYMKSDFGLSLDDTQLQISNYGTLKDITKLSSFYEKTNYFFFRDTLVTDIFNVDNIILLNSKKIFLNQELLNVGDIISVIPTTYSQHDSLIANGCYVPLKKWLVTIFVIYSMNYYFFSIFFLRIKRQVYNIYLTLRDIGDCYYSSKYIYYSSLLDLNITGHSFLFFLKNKIKKIILSYNVLNKFFYFHKSIFIIINKNLDSQPIKTFVDHDVFNILQFSDILKKKITSNFLISTEYLHFNDTVVFFNTPLSGYTGFLMKILYLVFHFLFFIVNKILSSLELVSNVFSIVYKILLSWFLFSNTHYYVLHTIIFPSRCYNYNTQKLGSKKQILTFLNQDFFFYNNSNVLNIMLLPENDNDSISFYLLLNRFMLKSEFSTYWYAFWKSSFHTQNLLNYINWFVGNCTFFLIYNISSSPYLKTTSSFNFKTDKTTSKSKVSYFFKYR